MKRFLSLALCLICCAAAVKPRLRNPKPRSSMRIITPDSRGQNISISVYNWGEYISDGSDDLMDDNAAFEELTGIQVLYTTFATNEELYAKLKSGRRQL